MIKNLFDWDKKTSKPTLTEDDESTRTPGLFLVGPEVRHEGAISCFIYKFHQRIPVVVKKIRKNLKKRKKIQKEYLQNGFYIKDLFCCFDECPC
ncbi:MAG: NAD(P)-binding domain-containing protein [Patescibacteria group bacterium]|nr:NAD(P)-binding domain-containing protein [Patescibacteria group bacterium]